MSHHRTRWRDLLHPSVPAGPRHPHIIAGSGPGSHPHLTHHVGHVLSLQRENITTHPASTQHNSHLARHSVLWRRRPVAHPVLHARVSTAHHVALHTGHHTIAWPLHHAGVARGPGHPTHVHAGTVGTHGVSHHHTVGSHHLHAATVGHHVGHGLARPHHVGMLHPHPHHHLLLLAHLTHAGVAGMHLEMLLLRAKY